MKPGDELKVETTICNEIRQHHQPVFIENVSEDPIYCGHPTPEMYRFKSYISVPLFRKDGRFFGTLCALGLEPGKIKTPEIKGIFNLFADLISFHLDAIEKSDTMSVELAEERHNSELRDQFIAILGHDLRNPIATARMSAEIILQKATDEISRRHARMIKSTSFRMEGLIENILDFARGRLGEGIQLFRKRDRKSLEKALGQVVQEIRTISPHRQIDVQLHMEQDVPCDENRLAQLFANLLGNADTHGSPDFPITVKIQAVADEFILTVTNGGEKIPDSAMKHLFQPFHRKEVKSESGGLGLGLFIASEIARAHEGTLDVKSTDKETRFSFRMPIKATAAVEEKAV